MFALLMTTLMSATTADVLALPDTYFSMTDPSGQYPLGWSHTHRDNTSVVYEDYARYPDGAFVFTKQSFRYDAQGKLDSFTCSTNYPADITSDAQAFGQGLAAQVAITGLSKVVTMDGFSLQEELSLNRWARTAKPGDMHSFKSMDCVKARVFDCMARAMTTTRMFVDDRRMEGLKVAVHCPEAGGGYTVWFDGEGNELSQLQSGVLRVREGS